MWCCHCVMIFQFQTTPRRCCHFANSSTIRPKSLYCYNFQRIQAMTLLLLATITLTMDKVSTGASKPRLSVQTRVKIKQSVKKSQREDECCRFYRFYHKFKQNKGFIGHDVMVCVDAYWVTLDFFASFSFIILIIRLD